MRCGVEHGYFPKCCFEVKKFCDDFFCHLRDLKASQKRDTKKKGWNKSKTSIKPAARPISLLMIHSLFQTLTFSKTPSTLCLWPVLKLHQERSSVRKMTFFGSWIELEEEVWGVFNGIFNAFLCCNPESPLQRTVVTVNTSWSRLKQASESRIQFYRGWNSKGSCFRTFYCLLVDEKISATLVSLAQRREAEENSSTIQINN